MFNLSKDQGLQWCWKASFHNDKCLRCWNWKFNKDLARNPARVASKTNTSKQVEFRAGKNFILLFWRSLLNKGFVNVLKFDNGHHRFVVYLRLLIKHQHHPTPDVHRTQAICVLRQEKQVHRLSYKFYFSTKCLGIHFLVV